MTKQELFDQLRNYPEDATIVFRTQTKSVEVDYTVCFLDKKVIVLYSTTYLKDKDE